MEHVSAIMTERLFLRPVELGDAAATATLMTPDISSMLTTWPPRMSVSEASARIAESRRRTADDRWIDWAIFLKRDLVLIGWVGLGPSHTSKSGLDMGYWLGEAFHGVRYGTEAVSAAIAQGQKIFNATRIEAFAKPINDPSISLLRRLGFEEVSSQIRYSELRGKCEEWLQFGLYHESNRGRDRVLPAYL